MNAMAGLATGSGLTSVVVTGAAMTTALATDVEATWKGLLDGQSGIRRLDDEFIDQFVMPVRIGGHLLEDFDERLTRVELRRFLYLQKISTVLGRRVWADAGSPDVDPNRLMVSIGTGMGSTEEFVRVNDDIRVRGIRAISPLGVQQAMPNAAAAAVGLERGARAGIFTPVSACASGAQAIALAWRNIVLGEAVVLKPGSRRSPWRRSPSRVCCRPTTRIRPARAARSTRIVTALCSAKRAR
jgi:beta-ketoacyl ACP synthase